MPTEKNKDRLFAAGSPPGDFVFDDGVARVFDDMINRSVPGYATVIHMLAVMAGHYCRPHSRIYDLGCSLGAASLAIAQQIARRPELKGCRIFAVDNSEAMIKRLQARLQSSAQGKLNKQDSQDEADTDKQNASRLISCHHADVMDFPLEDASMVVLNFTLQFIPPPQRQALIKRIYEGMREGGVLVLSEKIRLPQPQADTLFIDLHHRFKESMGYSKLEISRKRAALENVLLPETLHSHRARLREAGFGQVELWFQCFNFASIVAFKTAAPAA